MKCYSFNKVPTVERGPIHMRWQTIFRGFRKASHREPFAAASFSYGVFSHIRGKRIGEELGRAPTSELDIMMHFSKMSIYISFLLIICL